MFLIPGGSGTDHPQSRGFDVIAAQFFLSGWTVFLAETAGQNGRPGCLSVNQCILECRGYTKELIRDLRPSHIVLWGVCGGSVIACALACESIPIDAIVLWEPPPNFSQESRKEFANFSKDKGLVLSPDFTNEVTNLIDIAAQVSPPVLIQYGYEYPSDNLSILSQAFSNCSKFVTAFVPEATHSTPKSGDGFGLLKILSDVLTWLHSLALPVLQPLCITSYEGVKTHG